VSVCMCMYVLVDMYVCVYRRMYIYVCMCMYVLVDMYVCVYRRMYIYVWVCECVYVCACLYVLHKCVARYTHRVAWVALISRLLKNLGLFCRMTSLL